MAGSRRLGRRKNLPRAGAQPKFASRSSTAVIRPPTRHVIIVNRSPTGLPVSSRSAVVTLAVCVAFVTFRVTDSTGQTHQFKTRIQGSGKWETVRIPLAGRLEHWDGANDGKIHFPLTSLTFSVPSPGDAKQGKVEYSRIAAGGGEEWPT